MFRRKRKSKKYLLAIFLVALGGLGAWFVFYESDRYGYDPALVSPSIDPDQIASLALDFGDGTKREFEGEVLPPMSALDVLYSATLASKIEFDYHTSAGGAVVQNIAGKKNESSGKTWNLYVNNERIEGDPAVFLVNPADAIEWKYE